MPKMHVVRQGEHLFRIARNYGFTDYRVIYDHPKNAKLKQLRPNPDVLYPGDRVFIPDKQEKQEQRPTTQLHRFQKPNSTVLLRLVLQNLYHQPIANTRCSLQVEGKVFSLTTDADGLIEQRVSDTAESGRLTVPDRDLEVAVKIGHLDPVGETSGWRARLTNLGYYKASTDQTDEDELRSAVEEFQCDHGLKVDGICGPNTQAKLKEAHGS